MKKYKNSHWLLTSLFLLNTCFSTHVVAEISSFDTNIFKSKSNNDKALLGVWKSHGLSVPIEIKLTTLNSKTAVGTLKLDNIDLKFHKKVSISKIPHEYTYKFIYQIDKPKRVAGLYTFFPHVENIKMMRGIYIDLKGNRKNFNLYR